MFVHSVYFWLKPELTADQHKAFVEAAKGLKAIEAIRHAWVGVPADTDRPVIDRSYSLALTVVFDDRAAHDRYQADPLHEAFVERFKDYWSRVVIYDSVETV